MSETRITLPYNLDSEKALIGTVLIEQDKLEQLIETLVPDDFYDVTLGRIFEAMMTFYNERKRFDPILLYAHLKANGTDGGITGASQITNLSIGLPVQYDLTSHIETVRQTSYLRQLIRECRSIAVEASRATDPASVFVEAQQRITAVCTSSAITDLYDGFVPLKQVIHHDVLPGLEQLRTGTVTKIKTGFPGLDNAIGGGLSTSDVLLLAGLPSSGKSALALQIAGQTAAQGYPTAFLAGEMTNRENVNRMLSQLSHMTNLNSLQHISFEEHQELLGWCERIEDLPLYLDHRTSDMQTLSARIRALVRRHGIKVFVIDYIQLLKLAKVDRSKRTERITEASQEVKRLANELDVAIIEVAQFNREGAKSGKPSMHDLEGASQLEKDASLICIIDRDEVDNSQVTIRIVKGRNSGTGIVTGRFMGRYLHFDIPGDNYDR